MVLISKEEALALREKYGSEVGITIVNKHKRGGRKRYYVEETKRVFNFLDRFHERQRTNGGNKK